MAMETVHHKPSRGLNPGALLPVILGLGCISATIYGFNFKLAGLLPEALQKSTIHSYILLFMALSLLYLAAVAVIMKCPAGTGQSKWLLISIIALAVLFRLFLIPQDPTVLSSDMYRYVWDGRVQHNGFNPYLHAPNAEALKSLRDDRIYPHINRKEARTLYPAGAQLFFRGVYELVGSSVSGFKSVMVVFDLSAIAIMAALLRAYALDPNRLLIYAWNPLVIFEIAYSGHLEGITVFLMLAAFYLTAVRKRTLGIILLAMASAIKLYPGFLLPALLSSGRRIKGAAIFTVAFGLIYLPYVAAGDKMAGFLPVYLKNPYESFNAGLKYLLMHLFPSIGYYALSLSLIIALLAAGGVVLFKEKLKGESLYYGYILTGCLMVLMPAALHPWYVILIIPFLVFYTSAAWLIFSCAVTLSYLKYVTDQGIMPMWVLVCEYVPLLALLAWGFIYQVLASRTGGDVSSANRRIREEARL